MKISILFTSLFLSWVAFDPGLHRRSEGGHGAAISIYEDETEKQKIRKVHRRSSDVIPARFRRRKVRLRQKCSYFSVKSKDSRDSDQKKIRRKFNNM